MISHNRFLSLLKKQQHKILSQILCKAYQNNLSLDSYNFLANLLGLETIPFDQYIMSDRFHLHCQEACIHFDESHWPKMQTDSLSKAQFLPIDIYLLKLRSAHNVGSIIRTTEALRLGRIHACKSTPLTNHEKVKKISMGTSSLVSLNQNTPLNQLKKPFIALETTPNANNLYTFTFPPSFTLFLGNEQAGLDQKTLDLCDYHIQIPLKGMKNSLNVANAFAITASFIRSQNDGNKS